MVSQFPGDERSFLPRHCELNSRLRIEGIPQDIGEEAKKGDNGEDKEQDNEREDESVHGFLFLALWW